MKFASPITIAALIAALIAGAPAGAAESDLSKLSWLAGCWQNESAEAGSGERWSPLAGGTMFGIGRTVEDGKTTAFEFMQIRSVEGGGAEFVAQPSGAPPVSFSLVSISDEEAAFENLQHDFPTRIVYAREGDSELRARAEGTSKGKPLVLQFPMRRVSCDAPLQATEG